MAGQATPRKSPPSPNGAPTLTPLGHYAGRPDIAISRQVTIVGSKPGTRLHLASSTVSKTHAIIVNSAAGPYIRDLASRTKVIINGRERKEADLADGDLLQIGKFKFQFNEGVTLGAARIGEHDPAPGAVLVVEGGEMPVPFDGRAMLIGRRPTCDVPLVEDSVSTAHAVIFEMNGKRFIRDLGSRTGTRVNGDPIEQAELKFGDEIHIGETTIAYNPASTVSGVVDHDVDEMDHLVSTAPLGTAALDLPTVAPEVEVDRQPLEGAGDEDEADVDAAIPIEPIESGHGRASAGPVQAAPPLPPTPTPAPTATADQVRLDSDPDLAGGPGDTAVLPPAADVPAKRPTLKARLAADAPPPPATPPTAPLAQPQPPRQAQPEADIDDALGLTPEARRREQAKADDLGGSRRGWRGMSSDEIALPLGEHHAPPPQPPPIAAPAPAPAPVEPAPSALDETPAVEETTDDAADLATDVVEPEAAAQEAAAQDEANDEPPPAVDVEPELPEAEHDETAAPPDAVESEPPAAAAATPSHVTVGEMVHHDDDEDADALPVETFDVEPDRADEVAPLAKAPDVDEELHLPPVIDETLGSEDVLAGDELGAIDLPALPLTPEEGGAIDLSVDDEPAIIDEPPPALKFDDGADDAKDAPELSLPLAAEPEAPASESKRKRPARRKQEIPEADVQTAPVREPAPEPEPEPEPVVARGVEVVEETEPTPESALDIDDAVAAMLNEPSAPEAEAAASSDVAIEEASAMTDSTFGRAVEAFSGESTGPLVEARRDDDGDDDHDDHEAAADPPRGVEVEARAQDAEGDDRAARVKAIDELIADAFADDAMDIAEPRDGSERLDLAEPAEIPDRDAADVVAELDRAIEEAAGRARATPADEAPADEAPALDLAPVAEAMPSEPPAQDDEPAAADVVAEAIEPVAEAIEPVAEAIEPVAEAIEPVAEAPPQDGKPAAPPPRPPAAMPAGGWGANQDHFLGGMPLRLNKPVAEPAAPIGRVGVSFDKPPAFQPAASAPAAAAPLPSQQQTPPPSPPPPPPGQAPARSGKSPLFMPPPPPRATRPNARTRTPFDMGPGDVPVADAGDSIPPFVGGASPKAGQVTTGFDGLAMPPVRQTDVFSQMSTPAAFAAGLAGGGYDADADIFSRGATLAGAAAAPAAAAARASAHPQPQQPPSAPGADGAPAAHDEPDDGAPSPADDVWADDSAHPPSQAEPLAGAAHGSSRVAARGGVGAAAAPPDMPQPPAPGPPKRRRRWFGLRLMLVLMLLCALAAAAGVYGLVKKRTNVVGLLRFENFPGKTIEQQDLLKRQRELLEDQALRESARRLLAQRHPDVAPGFLASAPAYEAVAKAADWPSDGGAAKAALALPYSGRDERGDKPRVAAVLLALHEANAKSAGETAKLGQTIRALTAAHEKSQQRVAELKGQIEKLAAVAQRVPDRKQLQELGGEVARLDKAYNDAVRRVKDLAIDVEQMRKSMPANPQPAGTAQAPLVDPELTRLQEDLAATQLKLAEARSVRAKAADEAREALDAALDNFQKQIDAAKGITKDNPELSAYVAAASKLQASTRDLTDQLIRRQQEQQHRLTELKTRLGEQLEARRADAWKKDPKLRELSDELAIVQRQHNAAVGGGAKKEAAEFKSQIDLLEQMIKARQTLVGDDAFYADAIDRLQKIIDATQRGLDDDRKRTEVVLEEMQAGFTQSQPAVEKMPAAQKALAETLEKQLAEIAAARRQYTAAADAQAAPAGDEVKSMEAAASELATRIGERRKALAADAAKAATAEQEQQRVAALKDREAELVAAQTRESETRQAWEAAQRKLRDAQSAETESREAGERRDALIAERVKAEKELAQHLSSLEANRAVAARTATPLPPTDADVQMTVHDPRPVYALASVGGIVAVFTLLILFTSPGAASEGDAEPDVPMALGFPHDHDTPTPMPRADADAGNRASNHADEPRLAV